MAVLAYNNVLSEQRLDLSDVKAIDSYTASDFRALISFFCGDNAYVARGLVVTSSSSTAITVSVADALIFAPLEASGAFYRGAVSDSDVTVNINESNSTVYVEAYFSRKTQIPVDKGFWDELGTTTTATSSGAEFSASVNSQNVMSIAFRKSTVSFSGTGIPVAVISTNSAGNITNVEDARNYFFRLGTGGANPNPNHKFPWSVSRIDSPTAPTTVVGESDPASNFQKNDSSGITNDKGLNSFKEWMDAVTTRISELSGSNRWFVSSSLYSYVNNLTINNMFFVSDSGSYINSDPNAKIAWSQNTDTILRSLGTDSVSWQANYGALKWTLGGTFTSSTLRTYSNPNFASGALADGYNIYLQLEAEVSKGSGNPVNWSPSSYSASTLPASSGFTLNSSVVSQTASSVVGDFAGIAIGDFIRKSSQGYAAYYKVIKAYVPSTATTITTVGQVLDNTVTAVQLDQVIDTTAQESLLYFRTSYSNSDLVTETSSNRYSGGMNDLFRYWLARRTGSNLIFRNFGSLSPGEEVEVLSDSQQDLNVEDTNLVIGQVDGTTYASSLLSNSAGSTLNIYKRIRDNRVKNGTTTNSAQLVYTLPTGITVPAGQSLWVKLSDLTGGVLSPGAIDGTGTNIYEVRAATNDPLRDYNHRDVYLLARSVAINSATFLVFPDGSTMGPFGQTFTDAVTIQQVKVAANTIELNASGELLVGGQGSSINTVVRLGGGQRVKRVDVSANYHVLTSDNVVSVDSTSGAITINLPAVSLAGDGFVCTIKDKSGAALANNITVAGNTNTELIDNSMTFLMNSVNESATFICDGTGWEAI